VDAIRFRMDQAGLSQRDLVPYLGSKSKVSEVLSGKRPLTLSMIRALHEGLGIPADVLLRRSPDAEPDTEGESPDWSRMPVKEMAKRGWLKATPEQLKRHAGDVARQWFASVGQPQPAALFRTSRHTRSAREMDRYALTAWTARVLQLAGAQRASAKTKPVSIDAQFMAEVAHLSVLDNGPAAARDYLIKHGIGLVVEPHFPRTYLDGATIFGDGPVVGLTLRYDRLDNFWFTLMHELAHLALHADAGADAYYDDLDAASEPDSREKEADRLAADALIPKAAWKAWERGVPHSTADVEAFARSVRVHPAVVAGRLRHETGDFRAFSRMLGSGLVRHAVEVVG
jgi:HTH-type transcriptional regulator/antitoxin HigA